MLLIFLFCVRTKLSTDFFFHFHFNHENIFVHSFSHEKLLIINSHSYAHSVDDKWTYSGWDISSCLIPIVITFQQNNWIYALLLLLTYVVAFLLTVCKAFPQIFSSMIKLTQSMLSIYFVNNWLQLVFFYFSFTLLVFFRYWMIYIFRTPSRTRNIFGLFAKQN